MTSPSLSKACPRRLLVALLLLSPAIPAAAGVGRWTSGGPRSGAFVSAVVASRTAPLAVYAAAASYLDGPFRFFRSEDGGESWLESESGLPPDAPFLFSIAVDPADSSTVYAVAKGTGLFESTDRGAHWSLASDGLDPEDGASIGAFAIDPKNPQTLYLGVNRGSGKLLRSVDSGRSWVQTAMSDFDVSGLAIDPADSNVLYVTGYGYRPAGAGGVLKSIDRGATWALASAGLPSGARIVNPVIDPSDSKTLYCFTSGFFLSGELYKTTDGGAHWRLASPESRPGTVQSLAIDPGTPSVLYAATLEGGLFKSLDGGASWTASNAGLTNTLLFSVALDPSSPATLFVGSVAGIAKSVDAGASWRPGSLDLPAWVRAIASDPSGSTVYAGTLAGVFRSATGGASWEARNDGLPSVNTFALSLAVDPGNPRRVFAAIAGAGVFRSENGGASWSGPGSGMDSVNLQALVVDPSTPTTLYCATSDKGTFKSIDAGDTWSASSSGLSDLYATALAIDPTNPSRLYVGTGEGIFRSIDFGATWSLACKELPFAGAIVADGSSPGRIYAAGGGDLLRSLDGGETWSLATEGLPLPYGNGHTGTWVSALAISSIAPSILYAGTDRGLFRSLDGAQTWSLFGPSPSAPITALATDATGTILHLAAIGEWDHIETCSASPGVLCLLGGRFRITLSARDPRTGRIAPGRAIEGNDRFGYFSLPDFTGDPSFPEVFVKMLDATSLPGGRFWIFHTGLTDLEYILTVHDLVGGSLREYRNDRSDPSALCGGADTSAFLRVSPDPGRQTLGIESGGAVTACAPDAAGLCLLSGRFRATLSAEDPRTGRVASGRAISQGDRFGYFSLPDFTGDASFPEVFVKMLDATSLDGHFWVFHSGLTDLRYTLIVADLSTGETRAYQNRVGDPTRLCGGADTAAFGN